MVAAGSDASESCERAALWARSISASVLASRSPRYKTSYGRKYCARTSASSVGADAATSRLKSGTILNASAKAASDASSEPMRCSAIPREISNFVKGTIHGPGFRLLFGRTRDARRRASVDASVYLPSRSSSSSSWPSTAMSNWAWIRVTGTRIAEAAKMLQAVRRKIVTRRMAVSTKPLPERRYRTVAHTPT